MSVSAGPEYPATTTIISAVATSLIHATSEARTQGVIEDTITEFGGIRGKRADGAEVVITYPGERI